jgi:hypothetical protein
LDEGKASALRRWLILSAFSRRANHPFHGWL